MERSQSGSPQRSCSLSPFSDAQNRPTYTQGVDTKFHGHGSRADFPGLCRLVKFISSLYVGIGSAYQPKHKDRPGKTIVAKGFLVAAGMPRLLGLAIAKTHRSSLVGDNAFNLQTQSW